MNLICNNCASGFVYSNLKMEYNNPFMWNLISTDDFSRLILNWNRINFYSIAFPKEKPVNGVNITIDKSVIVKYIHIKYDKSAKQPVKKFVDIYSDKPWIYAFEKYITRLNRMKKENEPPTFLISDDTTTSDVDTVRPDTSLALLEKINNAKVPYKILWATPNEVNAEHFSNLDLMIVRPPNQYVGTVAKYLIDEQII